MARTAAAKKVAKAASAGGGRGRRGFRPRRDLMFPASMLVVVLVGVVLILVARDVRADNAPAGPPRLGDHWHSLYVIYQCDTLHPERYPNDVTDITGIHTHGDGLIHIHPFQASVTGQFATVGAFFREIEFELTDTSVQLPDGTVLRESDALCESPDPESDDPEIAAPGGEVRVLRWENIGAEKPLVFTEGLRDVRLRADGQMFMFAYVHPSIADEDIPRPDDTFLRNYLNLPAEDQPLSQAPEGIVGPVLEDGTGTEAETGTETETDDAPAEPEAPIETESPFETVEPDPGS